MVVFKRLTNVFTTFQRHNHKKWTSPVGYDTGLRIFNPITKNKVPLVLKNKHIVKWYICGPTVYDTSHIGHASCYVRFDIIRRILKNVFNIEPIVALNITDIDDKIIIKSKELNKSVEDVAKLFEEDFLKGMSLLNVETPSFILRVSEHINEIVKFIQKLVDLNKAYVTDEGNVYFHTQRYDGYGKLSPAVDHGQTLLQPGQQHAVDFALWKAAKPGEPSWKSVWGRGRPGWHIECSAMASLVFGSHVDIHSGGLDLVFPHHENEEAQSCAYHQSRQWVDYWIHAGHLLMNGQKMSKSLKNFIPITTFLEKYSADHLRMFCFLSHYRSGLDYSNESMVNAVAHCEKVKTFLSTTKAYVSGDWCLGSISEATLLQELTLAETNIMQAIADDFDTPAVMEHLQRLISSTNKMLHLPTATRSPVAVAAVHNFVQHLFHSTGFFTQPQRTSRTDTEFILDTATQFRTKVRDTALSLKDKEAKSELLAACDNVRQSLATIDITVKDLDRNNSVWSYGS